MQSHELTPSCSEGPVPSAQQATPKIVYCLGCGAEITSDEALIAWLKGKNPNPLSCPSCGELILSLGGRHDKDINKDED